MRKEISVTETGKTVEDAINKACNIIGHNREDCSWEIISLPKKKFFGLSTVPAKVRVFIEIPEEEKKPKTPEKLQNKEPAPKNKQPEPRREVQPSRKPNEAPAKKAKPAPVVTKSPSPAPRPVPRPSIPTNPNPVKDSAPVVQLAPEGTVALDSDKVVLATDYVKAIIGNMGIQGAEIVTAEKDGGLLLSIEGNDLGAFIGRRGETLDSVQYLTGLVANRLGGDYMRVTVDCGGYRSKREDNLVELAERAVKQVLRSNVSKALDPMTPAERRVVHATVSTCEGVSSHSIGSDPRRRVVIATPTSTSGRSAKNERSRGGSANQTERPRTSQTRPPREEPRTAPEPQKVAPPFVEVEPKQEQKKANTPDIVKEAGLYEKIDL